MQSKRGEKKLTKLGWVFSSTEKREAAILSLLSDHAERSAYQIGTALNMGTGTLYLTLADLEANDLIRSAWRDAAGSPFRRRVYYLNSISGRRSLENQE